ncbi:MAG: hypothetical protein HW391_1574 [Chloroflexi bacterium]|nr:hypothetical protein [Chloroflexota bacterium]
MYLNALEFLEEEREAWRPYEALATIPDDRLDEEIEGAHGWSARDLISHMVAWQEWALSMARDLAIGETSPTIDRMDAAWDARGDQMNGDIQTEWRALPIEEVRARLETVAGELRGHLTVVPGSRWVKNPVHLKTFVDETIDHYADHADDLAAVLAATRE